MTLQKGIKQFYFAQGVDTAYDASATPTGKMHILENARFENLGSLKKGEGSAQLTKNVDTVINTGAPATAGSFLKIANYNETKVAISDAKTAATNARANPTILKWDDARSLWQNTSNADIQGLETPHLYADSWPFSKSFLSRAFDRTAWIESEYVAGNMYILASDTPGTFTLYSVDFAARNVLFSKAYSGYNPRILKIGTSLFIFYYDNVNSIFVQQFTPSTSVFSGIQLVVNNVGVGGYFDVTLDVSNNRAYLAYKTSLGFPRVNSYNTLISGALGVVLATVNTFTTAIAMDTKITVWVVTDNMVDSVFFSFSYWGDTAVRTESLTTAFVYNFGAATAAGFYRVVALSGGGNIADPVTGNTGIFISYIFSVGRNKINTALFCYSQTVATTNSIYHGMEVITKCLAGSPNTIAFRGGRAGQQSVYLYTGTFDSKAFTCAGKLLYGKLFSTSVEQGILTSESFTSNVTNFVRVGENDTTAFFGAPILVGNPGKIQEATFGYNVDAFLVSWGCCELKDAQSLGMFRQSVRVGDALVMTGASPLYFDGDVISELGHLEFPDAGRFTLATAGAGNLSVGVYSYVFMYEWVDGNGRIHLSAPSAPLGITTTAGNNRVAITFNTNIIGSKPTAIRVYRTAANGSVYTFVAYMDFTSYDFSALMYGYTDDSSDSNISANEIVYTQSGEFSNINIGSCLYVAGWKDRVLGIFEDGAIYYSKKIEGSEPPEFAGELTIAGLDNVGGSPTAIAPLGDKFLIFKKERIYFIFGDGANDTGTFGDFSIPELLTDIYGCVAPASVINVEEYVYFQAKDGICRVGQDLKVQPIGRELNYFNTGAKIKSAYVSTSKREVRFSDGSTTYVWNYESAQWSIFTSGFISAEEISGEAHLVTSSGNLLKELTNGDTRIDGVQPQMTIGTGWINFENIKGFSRLYTILLSFRKRGNSNITVKLMYDDVADVVETHNITLDNASNSYIYPDSQNFSGAGLVTAADFANKPMVYRIKTARQKVSSVKIIIQDDTASASTTGTVDVVGLAIEYGFKANVAKLWMGDARTS